MKLDEKINEVLEKLKQRYKDELAAWIIYGTAADGKWIEGKSDIDSIIILKDNAEISDIKKSLDSGFLDAQDAKFKHLDISKEKEALFSYLDGYNLSIVEFHKISDYFKDIVERGRWTSMITILQPPRLVYSTREFEEFQKRLLSILNKKPVNKEKIIKLIKEKDDLELGLQFLGKVEGYKKSSCLHGHFRRKFQILSYYLKGKLHYKYRESLENIRELFSKEEYDKLMEIPKRYESREGMTAEEEGYYKSLALKATRIIEEKL